MEDRALQTLIGAAAFIGLLHTLTGPDHFVPFIAMSRVGRWSLRRTIAITTACGLAHVLGSVLLGTLGIALGWALTGLVWFEESRGELAAWLLLGFGIAYMAWGVRRAIRNRPHAHIHAHEDRTWHYHRHTHEGEHVHVHAVDERPARMTPWILFAVFVFGPCEPLIPVLMYPAAELSFAGILVVASVFGLTTLLTMLSIVVVAHLGLAPFSFPWLERYSHVLAGAAVTACGAAIWCGL